MKRTDDGAVTLYVIITVMALFAALGLVADVGGATVTKGRAIHNAYAAARAGAEAMTAATFALTGRVVTDPGQARQAALAYLQSVGAANGATVTVTGAVVTVHVRLIEPAHILTMFGITQFTVTGDGSATAVYGLRRAAP